MPLTAQDVEDLQSAFAALQTGNIPVADALVRKMPNAHLQPDALHLFGLIQSAQGRLNQARSLFEEAISIAPRNAQILNSYANLLDDLGEIDSAISVFEKAIEIDPNYVDAMINLGIVATTAKRFQMADKSLRNATRISPELSKGWSSRGWMEQQRGASEEALNCFDKALRIAPSDIQVRQNRAIALRMLDEPEAALAEFDQLIASGVATADNLCMRAHICGDLGHFEEAVIQYFDLLKVAPDHIDAHETLARLLPQIGRHEAALNSYRAALLNPNASLELWRSALVTANELADYDQLLAWVDAAEISLGSTLDFAILRATALGRIGDPRAALEILQRLDDQLPDNAAVQSHLAHTLLLLGDPAKAEHHALRATEFAPFDQSGWSFLTIIWRLLDDPRERWLADYDRLVMPIDLVMQDDLAALATTVESLHLTAEHPAEQSLRGGTQTRGNIFDKRKPDIRGFATQVRAAVESRLAGLAQDEAHPFLSRNSGTIDFAGSWSVRLRSSGFHTNHIHQMGWLSSAFYVSLPAEVGASSDAGALTFGVPDAAYGLDLAPRRIERPRAGRLVIFPSYFWHGTVPFESQSPRLTMAFDAVPA